MVGGYMNGIIITGIICLTLIIIAYLDQDKKDK